MIGVTDVERDLLDENQVAELTGLSTLTLRDYRRRLRKYRAGFPDPVRLVNDRLPLYLRSDVEGWMSRRPRRQGAPGMPRPYRRSS